MIIAGWYAAYMGDFIPTLQKLLLKFIIIVSYLRINFTGSESRDVFKLAFTPFLFKTESNKIGETFVVKREKVLEKRSRSKS